MFSIQNVQPEDAGRYVCTVGNEAGTTRDYGQLTVNGKIDMTPLCFYITLCLALCTCCPFICLS